MARPSGASTFQGALTPQAGAGAGRTSPAAALVTSDALRLRSAPGLDATPAGPPQPSAHLGSCVGPATRQAGQRRLTCKEERGRGEEEGRQRRLLQLPISPTSSRKILERRGQGGRWREGLEPGDLGWSL